MRLRQQTMPRALARLRGFPYLIGPQPQSPLAYLISRTLWLLSTVPTSMCGRSLPNDRRAHLRVAASIDTFHWASWWMTARERLSTQDASTRRCTAERLSPGGVKLRITYLLWSASRALRPCGWCSRRAILVHREDFHTL